MDRTKEFREYLKLPMETSKADNEEPFYVTINHNISRLVGKIGRVSSYKSIFPIEDEVSKLQANMDTMLGSIKIAGNADIQIHYSGIKQILGQRMVKLNKNIQEAKNKLSSFDAELFSEKPRAVNSSMANKQSLLMEQENKEIVQNTSYEVTRMRLQKIESVQKAINENLVIQDERIDNICETTGQTGMIYDELAHDDAFDSGSFFRRVLFIILICLSFVLLFLHYFYR